MTSRQPVDRRAAAEWLGVELLRRAPAWLPTQRWFGGKARAIAAVVVEDVLWLTDDAAVAILDVRYHEPEAGRPPNGERYAILAAIRSEGATGAVIAPGPKPGQVLIDAAADGPTMLALLSGLTSGTAIAGASGGRIEFADATPRAQQLLAAGPDVTPLSFEQSNTSVRLGSTHVFKLFRRLHAGAHPQLEIARQLAARRFAATPPLEGSLVYVDASGGSSALGALDGWIVNHGDGWQYVVERLAGAATDAGLAGELSTLGATTADFHFALAADATADAFAPEPVGPLDRMLWRDELAAQAERTIAIVLRQSSGWPEPACSLARTLVAARARLSARGPRTATARADFTKIRIHGDFHLGQVLRTADGFAIIDFEGEPGKPLADRRRKHCALKDVAGMLRSLDYASAAAGLPAAVAGPTTARLRTAFLDGYRRRSADGAATFLPASPVAFDTLLGAFEMEKALYEVEYEAGNRPSWVHIPLGAVARLFAGPPPASASEAGAGG